MKTIRNLYLAKCTDGGYMGKSSGIGGQAVLEGIMMKNKDKYAIAVRKPDNEIEIDVRNCKGADKNSLLKVPFVRGVFAFVDSLVLGIKSLTYSASFYEDEVEEKEKVGDKLTDKVFKEKAESVIMGFTVFLSIILSVLIFFMLPLGLSTLVQKIFDINSSVIVAIIDGVFRIMIFVIYILLISFMKDIQRTFMYHGAEHKCINCIESGLDLTVENVKISSRQHKRCGTSFLLFVMFVSVVFFILISAILPDDVNFFVSALIRLIFIPIIAGVSYELIRLAGNSDNKFVQILSAPGMLMQKLTTKEPTADMIEVAIAAVEAVFDWREYQKKEASDSEALVESEAQENDTQIVADEAVEEDIEATDNVAATDEYTEEAVTVEAVVEEEVAVEAENVGAEDSIKQEQSAKKVLAERTANEEKRNEFQSGADRAPKKDKKEKKNFLGKKDKQSKGRERESMVSYRVYEDDKELEELEEFITNLEENKKNDR